MYDMAWLLVSVSCEIPGIFWDRLLPTSFAQKNYLFISESHEISAVVYHYLSQSTHKQDWTDLLQIAGRWETAATCSHLQQDSSWVECTNWLLLIHCLNSTKWYISQEFPLLFVVIFLCYFPWANQGYTETSARSERIQIAQIDGRFIQCVSHWHTPTMLTPVSPSRCCQWRHQNNYPGWTFNNRP